MEKKSYKYNLINLAVILATAMLFVYDYRDIMSVFQNISLFQILILMATVLLVHAVKAGRLYLALYGSDISFLTYLKVYCKVTPISVVIPYKLGEFFRMYCYGRELRNYLKGIIIVLLDRFMDTIALVSMIILIGAFNGGSITSFVYILLAFLCLAVLLYLVFPGVYTFWKQYILRAKATEHKLAILKMLETLNRIYQEIKSVSRGRGVILYFMSLVAWGVEIGSIALISGLSGEGKLNKMMSGYLASAMSGNKSAPLKRFVFVSVVLMILMYVIIKAVEMLKEKRDSVR